MKKVLLFSFFFTTIVYSQQDTIQIKEHDITYIHKEYPILMNKKMFYTSNMEHITTLYVKVPMRD